MPQALSAALPSAVTVKFPAVLCDGSTPPNPDDPPYYYYTVPITSVSDSIVYDFTSSPLTGSPGAKIFHSATDALATAYPVVSVTNAAALDALALQVATDFYNWHALAHDVVWNGALNWQPEGFTDELIFTYHADDITTRAATGPYDADPEELAQTDNATCNPPCSGYTGTVTLQYDVQCANGIINVYTITETYNCGLLTKVGAPTLAHTAGCCNCASSSSSAGY